jgi:hypothetical protein
MPQFLESTFDPGTSFDRSPSCDSSAVRDFNGSEKFEPVFALLSARESTLICSLALTPRVASFTLF